MNTELIVRKIMHYLLTKDDCVNGPVFGIETYVSAIEETKVKPESPGYETYECRIKVVQVVIEYHTQSQAVEDMNWVYAF
jgi:hypothetical protein